MPMTREQILQEQASARVIQERYDNALQPWGARADPKPFSQDVEEYQRNLAVRVKKLLPEGHPHRKVKIWGLASDAFAVLEPQILNAVADSAWRPDAVPKGTTERRVSIDANGLKMVNYIGQESFVKEMGRPGRRVASFRTDHGYVSASGRPLR
jgi:hypothetical protein